MKTLLFDFDGTLVDSMPTFISVMLSILDEYEIPYEPDIMKAIVPLGYEGTAQYYIGLGLPLTKEEILKYVNDKVIDAYTYHIEAKPNVIAVLKQLKENGCDLNILTASPHAMLDPCLKRLGIYDLFTHVWSCDDFRTTKADAKIYEMAAEKIGVSVAEILFLDDNYNANKAAKMTGMQVCGVYDESSREYEDEMRLLTDRYIRDFEELL